MRILFLAAVAISVSIASGCASTPDYQPISTEEQYRASVVGRSINLGNSASTTTHPDGTMTGTAGKREILGTWSWEGNQFCREGTIGDEELQRDCQNMEIAGDQLRITRGDGSIGLFDLR